jgi:hypothetical protein
MALTLTQVDALLDAAYVASANDQLSFRTPGGHEVVFHTLQARTAYIDWLEGKRRELIDEAAAASGDPASAAPVVSFQEPCP